MHGNPPITFKQLEVYTMKNGKIKNAPPVRRFNESGEYRAGIDLNAGDRDRRAATPRNKPRRVITVTTGGVIATSLAIVALVTLPSNPFAAVILFVAAWIVVRV